MAKKKKPRPYHDYPFILSSRKMICEFLDLSINALPAFIEAGAPVLVLYTPGSSKPMYKADKLALRQWMGVKTIGMKSEGGGEGRVLRLPGQASEQTRTVYASR